MTDMEKMAGLEAMMTEEELDKVSGGQIFCRCAFTDATHQFIRINIVDKKENQVAAPGGGMYVSRDIQQLTDPYTIPTSQGMDERGKLEKMYPGITFVEYPFDQLY